jgi:predicted secreted hydrolase
MKPIQFPQDELAHNHAIEWWYWNGHLQDKRGNRYSYMDCLFKANPKKVKFPFLRGVPVETLYFYHSLITDIKKKKFYPRIDYVSIVSKDSFSKPLLFINFTNPVIVNGYFNNIMHEVEKDHYNIKTEDIELQLDSKKKPLLEGGSGYLRLPNSRSTYYYSLTNLKTEGKIRVGKKWIEVTGKSWMDHQWANVKYEKDKWTWFSIQLNNNTEIVCIEYGNNKIYKLASISYPDNKQKHTRNIQFTPLGKQWKSQKTKAEYPLEWKIEIPEFKVDLTAKALVKQQEMLFGTINYWEGPLDIKGKMDGKKVTGVGFSELVGYPSEMNNIRFVRNTFSNIVRKGIAHIKGRL